ncbi:MAG: hypothetical protein QM658_03100 [Gordonia sp. (in: high G+C Gram-positive bacteria)]
MAVEIHRSVIDTALTRAAFIWADSLGRTVVDRAQAILVERGHVGDGNLLRSVDHTVVTASARGATVVVGSSADYAGFFHTGTGVHGPYGTPIVPTRRRSVTGGPPYLKFAPRGSNTYLFRRSVKGMKASPFLADALRDVLGSVTRTRT